MKKLKNLSRIIITFLIIISAPFSVYSQLPIDPRPLFNKMEAMIPMRDGIRLNTEIYITKNSYEPLPFLMMRTPYGLYHDQYGYYWRLGGSP